MNFLFKNEVVNYDFFNTKNESTILFLHGWGGNKFSFSKTINFLKSQFNILSISIPTNSPTLSIWNLFDYTNLIENILLIHSINNVIIICHSFGCRLALLLKKKITISKIIITGGAGINKKINIFSKITRNNNKILLKSPKNKYFYKKIASSDYLSLSKTNKESFKNIINLNLKFTPQFNCPVLLYWGNKDYETKIWIAKYLKKHNNTKIITTKGDHFVFLKKYIEFNHIVTNFIKNS